MHRPGKTLQWTLSMLGFLFMFGMFMSCANDASSYRGTLNGVWQGSGLCGSFTITIDDEGKITGSFKGDDSGSFTGTVSDSGVLTGTAKGSSSGYSWTGILVSANSSVLSGSGTWSNSTDGTSGTWSTSGSCTVSTACSGHAGDWTCTLTAEDCQGNDASSSATLSITAGCSASFCYDEDGEEECVSGSVSGNSVSISFQSGDDECPGQETLKGTITGSSLSGTFGTEAGGSGTWSCTRD